MPRKATPAARLVPTAPADLVLRCRAQRPAYEIDPPPRLIDALRQAFGTFFPKQPREWYSLERTLSRWYADHHHDDPAAYGRFVEKLYPAWGADDVIGFLVELGLAKRTHDTSPKREALDGLWLRLVKHVASDKNVGSEEAMRLVDSMSHQGFADAVAMEFDFPVSAKSVQRWRLEKADDRRHNTPSTGRPHGASRGRRQAAASSSDRIVDQGEVKQAGLSERTRPDAVTRLGPGDDPADLVAERRKYEAEAKAITARIDKALCQCREKATRAWEGKPVCDDCYAELEAEAAAKT